MERAHGGHVPILIGGVLPGQKHPNAAEHRGRRVFLPGTSLADIAEDVDSADSVTDRSEKAGSQGS